MKVGGKEGRKKERGRKEKEEKLFTLLLARDGG